MKDFFFCKRVYLPVFYILICIFQERNVLAQTPITQTFSCTGIPETFVVPCTDSITVSAWGGGGAGGGNDSYTGAAGGGGAFSSSTIAVTNGDILTVMVGCGGQNGTTGSGGGGGAGAYGSGSGGNGGNPGPNGSSGGGGGGGGGTGLWFGGTVLLVAGGGGGGGGGGQYGLGGAGGGGGANGTQGSGTGNDASFGVAGGSGSGNGTSGASHGDDGGGGGGGGGGLNGGTGGSISCDCGGGGAGGGTSLGTNVMDGSGQTPGNSADPSLCAGCAQGGGIGVAGGNGMMIITYTPYSIAPTANFSVSPVCSNTQPTQFTDLSLGASSWNWNFGDPTSPNNTSILPSPSHTFTSPGTYSVSLTVTNLGCSNTITKTVVVNPAPVAGFGTSNVCFGNPTQFSNLSVGNNLQWNWDFGDGSGTSTASDPVYQYTTDGTFIVKLIAVSDSGCSDTISQTIQVYPMPVASFNTSNVCVYDSAQFVDFTSITNGTLTWDWDFGDGTGSTLQFPAHLYGTSGNFNVQLVVVSDSGCTDSVSKPVFVNPAPVSSFSTSNNCLFDTSFFSNNSTLSSGNITGWSWDFGDGSGTSSAMNPSYLYPGDGTYTVLLAALSDSGCSDTATQTIQIYAMPVAAFSTANICLYDSAHFTDLTTISNGTFTWSWDFGDGNNSSLQNPAHLYSTEGSNTVSLTVGSNNGCIDSVSAVIVAHPVPAALFTTNNICHFDTSFFTNNSSVATGIIASWIWDFGDGGSSSAQNPSHLYNTDGFHNITLIAITDSGCSDTVSSVVTVYPAADAMFSAGNECTYDSVYFINVSTVTSGGLTYSWDLDDGTTSAQQNISHLYSAFGNYNVTLIATSDSGCTDTFNLPVFINPAPTADFTSTDNCLYDTSFFNNSSSIPSGTIAGWNWNFGDGTTSSAANPFHLYSAAGIYSVTLIASSDSGCTDTTTINIEKFPIPVANFSPDTVCLNDSTQFVDLSTISGGSIVSWVWNFGDGTPNVYVQNPYHYFALGFYNVILLAISDKGCLDDSTKQVGVHPLPVADFGYSNGCINEQPTLFSDSSTVANASIVKWQWDFGDMGTSNVQNPNHTYSAEGTYTIGLIVTSSKSCTDTLQQQIRIYPKPQVGFSANDTDGCQPFCIDFSDFTTISQDVITSWEWDFGNGITSSLQDPPACYPDDGTYTTTLIATTDKGCKDTLTKINYITVYPLPQADFSYSPQSTNVQDMNILFTDLSSGNLAQWDWTFFDNDGTSPMDSSSAQHPSFDFATNPENPFVFFLEDTGEYLVQLVSTTINGCKDTAYKNVRIDGVFYSNIPNSFSPNGDGINDFFFPHGVGIDPFRDFNFFVFNRWGELLFESHNLDKPWDGTFKGQVVQQDVYIWSLEFRETTENHKVHEYVGHVTVLNKK